MAMQESKLAPLKLASDTLSELGKNPATKVRRVSFCGSVTYLPVLRLLWLACQR